MHPLLQILEQPVEAQAPRPSLTALSPLRLDLMSPHTVCTAQAQATGQICIPYFQILLCPPHWAPTSPDKLCPCWGLASTRSKQAVPTAPPAFLLASGPLCRGLQQSQVLP